MARPSTTTPEQRQQIIELKRRHSFTEVAELLGLPVGTVKTIARRSGAFSDNPKHRELFTLPPLQGTTATSVAAVTLPEQRAQTGDKELDAVLWLRETIQTGNPALIEKALAAAERIKTPPRELESRYAQYLLASTGNTMTAAFGSIGFANLRGLAERTRAKAISQAEAAARFGDDPDMMTEADRFCVRVLKGARAGRHDGIDDGDAAARFRRHPELMPHTLEDCLNELAFWDDLYRLRNAATGWDGPEEVYAREHFTVSLLAEIRPRHKAEAKAVLRYLIDHDRKDSQHFDATLENLLSL